MDKPLHIVCFDAPSPPDYGGAIDLYYKIIALANAGVQIRLHYFNYKANRGHSGLEPFCKNIFTYKRKTPLQCLHSPLPYIVSSRINKALIDRLNEDDFPILIEGVHCCGILPYIKNKERKIVVRMHNNEAAYYQRLSHAETSPLKNFYYLVESNRLERYQQRLPKNLCYAALSETDVAIFQGKYGLTDASFVPCFTPWQELKSKEGSGTYCLYHGNLSVAENSAVALWLIKHVFSANDFPLVIAGKNAPVPLQKAITQHGNIRLVENPTDSQMAQLVQDAQINLVPSLNETGVKLKLLHSLFSGRHCMSNKAGVMGSGLESLVHLAEDVDAMQTTIKQLMAQPFTEKEMQQRSSLLHQYNNNANAEALIALIWKRYQ